MGDRLIAAILDGIFLAAVYAVIGMAVAARGGGITESGFSLEGTPALIGIGLTLLAGFLYFWVCEGLFGATLGKALVGIQVRGKSGGRCGLGPSLVRNLLRIVDGIGVYLVGLLIAILSKLRQRLGDHVANTVVVERRLGRVARAAVVILWLGLIGGGLLGAYLLHRGAPGGLRSAGVDFLQRADGPSRPAAPYKPGDSVYIKYDVAGYARNGQGRPELLLQVVALDPNKVPLHAPWENQFNGSVDRNSPVHGTFRVLLPTYAPPGTYTIDIKVHDQVKNTDLQLKPTFQVEAPVVAPATGLEIRDFQLSLSKDGPSVEAPVLEGGGTVYMKCNLLGLQFRGDEVQAQIALKVIGPSGNVLLDRPDFVQVNQTLAYHPPTLWVPVNGEVSVPTGFEKGTYTEQYAVTDLVANQTIAREAKFQVK